MLKLPGMVVVKSSLELAYTKVVKTNKIGVSIKLTPILFVLYLVYESGMGNYARFLVELCF